MKGASFRAKIDLPRGVSTRTCASSFEAFPAWRSSRELGVWRSAESRIDVQVNY